MTEHRKILNLIGCIRDSVPKAEYIFCNGSCMNLFCILHSVYPQAKAWSNVDHIITEIEGKFYDIRGVVDPTGYIPFTEESDKKTISKAFKKMYTHGTFTDTYSNTT